MGPSPDPACNIFFLAAALVWILPQQLLFIRTQYVRGRPKEVGKPRLAGPQFPLAGAGEQWWLQLQGTGLPLQDLILSF